VPPVPTDRAGLPAHLAGAPLGDPSVFWELATDLLAVIGTDGRFKAANPAWLRVLGRRPEDVVGCYPPDLIHPDDLSRTLAARDEHLAPGSVLHDFANRYRHADGTYRWIRWSGHRTGAGWWIIGRDCTDEKARDDAMRRQERHQRALLGALQDGLCAIDARGRIVDVNDRLCAMLDLRREALLGVAPPLPMWPPEEHERFAAQLAEVLATGEPGRLDATLVDAGGRRFPVVVEYAPVADPADPGDPVALCTVRDVTQEVAERRRLRRSEARLRAAHRAAHLSGWEWSPDGRELWMSRELPALAGVAVPRSLDDAMDVVPQPYRAELEEGLRAVAGGQRDEFRLWHPVDVPNPRSPGSRRPRAPSAAPTARSRWCAARRRT
jgi:PAS domain S-box-containing protein